MKYKIYIASPYTNGNQIDNVRLQIDAKHKLLKLGQIPFAPLLGHFFELVYPQKYNNHNMLEWDIFWLKTCDIVVRIHPRDENGEELPSPGADTECEAAQESNIPVYHFEDLKDMESFFKTKKNLKKIQSDIDALQNKCCIT